MNLDTRNSSKSVRSTTHSYSLLCIALIGILSSTSSFSEKPHTHESLPAQNVSSQTTMDHRFLGPPEIPQTPKIQIAMLLDTSSSMDGLINQARQQLWEVINEFSTAQHQGVKPQLFVSIYEYGNDSLSADGLFIRQAINFSSDLDKVSEALYSLTTNGGQEYCGAVIDKAISELQWSSSNKDIKAIFIAGNESFEQGPMKTLSSINKARLKGITVNTVHAGDFNTGVAHGWQKGATLAGGNYMHINQNQAIAHVETPHDQRIIELNQQLNQTYVPYGKEGLLAVARQQKQDSLSANVSKGLLAKRVKSKTSDYYANESWDLVDAVASNNMALDSIGKETLPKELQTLNEEQQKAFIEEKMEQRKKLKSEILEASRKRDAFIAEAKKESAKEKENALNHAMINAIKKQAKEKHYTFEKE